ncbi:BadF/BadG/BcrA/BcrD ATPase family protein [Aquimarina sp. I32.4]|uniref:BadF/BadG/BcrA/BcrD ATPase family protein n=1 Tax=Aquimarina sp. I32.4 TaxID=2053903 RepID=UPI000CDE6A1B|nr:BadF/BadG/BcrA/BcrD ATPase family protein [Aquimarina sp. I32.4]
MILFADSGSTKCDWVLAKENGEIIHKTQTHGINPFLLSDDTIIDIIKNADVIPQKSKLISEIHFYGAGCGQIDCQKKIDHVLRSIFENVKSITIEEDIIGAVKATTTKPGIVCILGTGTNCCFFDGKKVIQKFPALGYLLADEGSGNYLGKKIIKDYFLGKMPSDVALLFKNDYASEIDQLLDKLYTKNHPNKYLASYAQFIFRNRGNAYIESVLHQGISDFIDTYLFHYKKELSQYPIHFVGSVAYYSQDIIKTLLDNQGYRVKSFVKKPIDQVVSHITTQKISQ